MTDSEDALVISHLSDSRVELEQVVRINELAWGQTPGVAETERRVNQLRQLVADSTPEERCLLIAVRAGEVVGFAQVAHYTGEGSPWILSRLVVHPGHQRCGVATKLCEACIAHAKTNGATAFLSETHLDNAGSIAFHNAFGFRDEGESTRADGDKKVRYLYSLSS